MASIPASAIVNIIPNVLSAGGTGLDLVGLIVTPNTQLPVGAVLSFSSPADVATYFGALSDEANLATTYFLGFDGSTVKPAKLWLARAASAVVAGYLRGAKLGLTLDQVKALSGVLTINVEGSNKTSSAINLSAATSFTNAATIIQAAFTSPGFTVSYDSLSGAFAFTTTSTGATATIGFASGTLSAGLKLTAATGAVTSQGSAVQDASTVMDAVVAQTQDFVAFMTTWEPVDDIKMLFAAWANAKANRYAYVPHTNIAAATATADATTIAPKVKAAGYGSVAPVYDPANGANVAAALLGYIASLDTGALNGRATMAFREGNVVAGVTSQTAGDNLIANGYNFVGSYATANDGFVFLYPGQISGDFDWIDSWVSQVWLNNAMQLALMLLLRSMGQIPYNADGYALVEAAMSDPVERALNFGAIRAGVSLSNLQKTQINNAAGGDVASIVEKRGWYIKVQDAAPQVRPTRGSPPIFLWYTDGQSIQKITLNSIAVQ